MPSRNIISTCGSFITKFELFFSYVDIKELYKLVLKPALLILDCSTLPPQELECHMYTHPHLVFKIEPYKVQIPLHLLLCLIWDALIVL